MKRSGIPRRKKGLTRREELRRSTRALRKTPLAPGKQGRLERKAIARVTADLRGRSKKMAKIYKDKRIPFVRVTLQRYPFCETAALGLGVGDGTARCLGRSSTVHETWRGSRPNNYLVPRRAPQGSPPEVVQRVWAENRRQFLALCVVCHDWIHGHPLRARETTVVREGVSILLLRRNLEE